MRDGSGTGAVTLELQLAEVDHDLSSTRTVLLRRPPETAPPDMDCMIRVGNLPTDPKPVEINRKLADIFADTLFEDAHRHPKEKNLDSAESAVAAVTVQLRKGFRANIGMVTLANELAGHVRQVWSKSRYDPLGQAFKHCPLWSAGL